MRMCSLVKAVLYLNIACLAASGLGFFAFPSLALWIMLSGGVVFGLLNVAFIFTGHPDEVGGS